MMNYHELAVLISEYIRKEYEIEVDVTKLANQLTSSKKRLFVTHHLPPTGFLRLSQIIGDRKESPPIPGIIPVSQTVWWCGVKDGVYPKPVKPKDCRVTLWRVEDILGLVEKWSTQNNFDKQ